MNSIRRQLLMSLLAGLTLVLSAAGVALFLRARVVLTREFDRTERAEAALLSAQTEDDGEKVHLDLAGLSLPEYDHDEYYQLWVADGQTIARSPSLDFGDLPQREGNLVLPDGRPGRAIIMRFFPMPAEEDQPANPHPQVMTLVIARHRVGLDRTLAGHLDRAGAGRRGGAVGDGIGRDHCRPPRTRAAGRGRTTSRHDRRLFAANAVCD